MLKQEKSGCRVGLPDGFLQQGETSGVSHVHVSPGGQYGSGQVAQAGPAQSQTQWRLVSRILQIDIQLDSGEAVIL